MEYETWKATRLEQVLWFSFFSSPLEETDGPFWVRPNSTRSIFSPVSFEWTTVCCHCQRKSYTSLIAIFLARTAQGFPRTG
jgi:hypothetical protein